MQIQFPETVRKNSLGYYGHTMIMAHLYFPQYLQRLLPFARALVQPGA